MQKSLLFINAFSPLVVGVGQVPKVTHFTIGVFPAQPRAARGGGEKRVSTHREYLHIYISTHLHIYTSTHPHTGHTDNDATHSFPHIISSVRLIVTTLLVIYSANMISASLPGKNCG